MPAKHWVCHGSFHRINGGLAPARLDTSELVALDARSLRDKAQMNPEFGYDLLTRMSKMMWERLQNTRRRLVELYVA